jgi:uncharacterized phosphosugar-binding protein
MIDRYYQNVISQLSNVVSSQKNLMTDAAKNIDERLRLGNILHLFGSGHSHLAAEDCLYRAGCFAPCNVILPKKLLLENGAVAGTMAERQSGIAEEILREYDVRANDVLVIFSQSGINNVPVEMAANARRLGIFVIGIGSQKHTNAVKSRSSDKAKLVDRCNIFIDNQCDVGDACIEITGNIHCGPTSTILGSFIIQAILCEVAERMTKDGLTPPVYVSANLGHSDDNHNLIEKYRMRIKHL